MNNTLKHGTLVALTLVGALTACAVDVPEDEIPSTEERADDSELSDEAPIEVPSSLVLTADKPWEACSDNETAEEVNVVCKRPRTGGGLVDSSTPAGGSCVVKFSCWDLPAPVMGYECPAGRGTGTTIEDACWKSSGARTKHQMTWPRPPGEVCDDWSIFTPDWIIAKTKAFCQALPPTVITGTGMCCTLKPTTPTTPTTPVVTTASVAE